jgi:predicted amidohydrolase
MAGDFLRVGAVSLASTPGDTAGNLQKIKEWCRKAVQEQIEVLLFPELSLSGYWWNTELYYEAQPQEGQAVRELITFLSELKTDMAISVGLAEKYGGTIYNCQILLDRTGIRHYYRKTHWPHAEMGTWGCGDRYSITSFQGFNIGTAICYDNNFPEVHRILALHGADICLSPYAYGGKFDPAKPDTVKKAISNWKEREMMFLKASAAINYMWMVACVGGGHVQDYHAKDTGKGEEHYFPGVIFFVDPDGKIVKESPDDEITERLLWHDLGIVQLWELRRGNYNHFKDRRIITYNRLTELP